MAKGDSGATQSNSTLVNNLTNKSNTFFDDYTKANTKAATDYDSIFGGYQSYFNPTTAGVGEAPRHLTGTGAAFDPKYSGPVDLDSISNYFSSYGQAKGGDPSAVNDPKYWANTALEKIGKGADVQETLNFLTDRISNGSGGGGGFGGGMMGSFNPSAYGGYQAFANGEGALNWDPEFRSALSKAIGGFGGFAENGGFSDRDISDIRARAIAPTRSVYSQAQQNVNRNRSLQGYSPNYAAATAKMARDLSSGISDANVNANASIAQMVQQGKLAGLQGLTSAGLGGEGMDFNIGSFNDNLRMRGLEGMNGIDQFAANFGLAQGAQRLQALNGAANLYGTTPANARLAGDMALGTAREANNARISERDPNKFGWRDAANLGGSVLGTVAPLIGGKAAAGAGGLLTGGGAAGLSTAASVPAGLGATTGLGALPGGFGAASLANPAAVGSGSSAGSALGGLFSSGGTGAYAGAGPALLAPAIAYGLNKGGSGLLNWGERLWGGNPLGSPQNPMEATPDPFDTSNWTEDDWARIAPYL